VRRWLRRHFGVATHSARHLLGPHTVLMDVLLASSMPLTRFGLLIYGDERASATWIDAGPQGMNWAKLRSRIRCRLLWTCSIRRASPACMDGVPASVSMRSLRRIVPWSFHVPASGRRRPE